MSDQFALGLLAQLVEQTRTQTQAQIDALTQRVDDLEAVLAETEGAQYLDGSK